MSAHSPFSSREYQDVDLDIESEFNPTSRSAIDSTTNGNALPKKQRKRRSETDDVG